MKLTSTQVLVAQFAQDINGALARTAENFDICHWPADAPRFHLIEHSIDHMPASQLWQFSAIVSIFGPEREDCNYSRPHWLDVKEEFYLPGLSGEHYDNRAPYFEAFSCVLAFRVAEIIHKWQKDGAG